MTLKKSVAYALAAIITILALFVVLAVGRKVAPPQLPVVYTADMPPMLYIDDKLYRSGMYASIDSVKQGKPVGIVESCASSSEVPFKNNQTNDAHLLGGEIFKLPTDYYAVATAMVYTKTTHSADDFFTDGDMTRKKAPDNADYLVLDDSVYQSNGVVPIFDPNISPKCLGEVKSMTYFEESNGDEQNKLLTGLRKELRSNISYPMGTIFDYSDQDIAVLTVSTYTLVR